MRLKVNFTWVAIAMLLPSAVFLIVLSMLLNDLLAGEMTFSATLIALTLLGIPLLIGFNLVNEIRTELSACGISKRFLFRRRNLEWEEVSSIKVRKLGGNIWTLELCGRTKKISINAFLFGNVSELIGFLESKLPERVFTHTP
jgi:hypothetical protein